jgi:hypothetical protein
LKRTSKNVKNAQKTVKFGGFTLPHLFCTESRQILHIPRKFLGLSSESKCSDFGRDPCQNHAWNPGHSKQIPGGMHGISLELCGIFHMEGIRNFPGPPKFHAQSMLSFYME